MPGTPERLVETGSVSGLDRLSKEELIALVLELHQANAALTERIASLEKENEELRPQILGAGSGLMLRSDFAE
jgi:hypothetical protein